MLLCDAPSQGRQVTQNCLSPTHTCNAATISHTSTLRQTEPSHCFCLCISCDNGEIVPGICMCSIFHVCAASCHLTPLTSFVCRTLPVSRLTTSPPSRAGRMLSAEQQQRWRRRTGCEASCLSWSKRRSSCRRTRRICRRTRCIYRRVSMLLPRSHSSPLQKQAACMCNKHRFNSCLHAFRSTFAGVSAIPQQHVLVTLIAGASAGDCPPA